MPMVPCKFKHDEDIAVVGNRVKVSGILQLQDAAGQVVTRYLLTGGSGTTQILEERGDRFHLLRPFPPVSQPQVDGKSVVVMGDKYTLADIAKLTVVGIEGQAPGAATESQLLLSGRFAGAYSELLREIVAGSNAQAFYSLKPVSADDLQTAAQIATIEAAEALLREQTAQAEAESAPEGGWKTQVIGWVVVIVIFVFMGYACSGSDSGSGSGYDPGGYEVDSSGSARSASSHSGGGFHGK